MDIVSFKKEVARRKINCVFLTPKMLEAYVVMDVNVFDNIKLLQFAGEEVKIEEPHYGWDEYEEEAAKERFKELIYEIE